MNDSTRALRAVIADDERLMREQLRTRLAEAWPALELVAEAKNGAEAVQLDAEQVDAVFLERRTENANAGHRRLPRARCVTAGARWVTPGPCPPGR